MTTSASSQKRFGQAWLVLTLALALHVTDEALTDFLGLYNPTVNSIRQRLPWLPLPTFTFGVWLAGLIAAITVLLFLTKQAFSGSRILGLLAYPFSVLMIGNALLHFGASIFLARPAPGVTSSPVLLAAAIYLLFAARRASAERSHNQLDSAPNPSLQRR